MHLTVLWLLYSENVADWRVRESGVLMKNSTGSTITRVDGYQHRKHFGISLSTFFRDNQIFNLLKHLSIKLIHVMKILETVLASTPKRWPRSISVRPVLAEPYPSGTLHSKTIFFFRRFSSHCVHHLQEFFSCHANNALLWR